MGETSTELKPVGRYRFMALIAAVSLASLAAAQTTTPSQTVTAPATTSQGASGQSATGSYSSGPIMVPPAAPVPYSSLPPIPANPSTDAANVNAALAAAKQGDASRIRSAMNQIYDPVARKIALWALIDGAPTAVSFAEADEARRELVGWPRELRREETAEASLPLSGLPAPAIIAWFGADQPRTGPGVLALAGALETVGRSAEARDLIRRAWRTRLLDQPIQDAMMARFGVVLTADDYAAREDLLLYGAHDGPALDLLRFLTPDQQALAQARMAVRRGDSSAETLIAALPPALQTAPGLTFERVMRLHDQSQDLAARQLANGLAEAMPDQVAATKLWRHGYYAIEALEQGDTAGAYAVAAHSGLTTGPDAAEAQFLAGWIALSRLKDPRLADVHFAKIADAGGSPLTQSRAYYWRGRAAEAEGDVVNAQIFYSHAGSHTTAFYGLLAAERNGVKTLTLGHDPAVTQADRSAFEARDVIRAMRYLVGIGARDEFKVFAADLADVLPTVKDEAMLVDLARGYGDQEAGMRVVRNAAKRGFILPERGYPLVASPTTLGGPEPALVLAVTRQESSFDPYAHSHAGARGMMQLMPATAETLARQLGMS
ncbi:MAG TPA: lytic transglycosylase domain-containing protein, partial [Caulobacteraceae bacterium]